MNDEEELAQVERLHVALREGLELPEDAVLTGWCVAYECRTGDEAYAGEAHGPATVTSWTAIGLLEWARICMEKAVPERDEEDED